MSGPELSWSENARTGWDGETLKGHWGASMFQLVHLAVRAITQNTRWSVLPSCLRPDDSTTYWSNRDTLEDKRECYYYNVKTTGLNWGDTKPARADSPCVICLPILDSSQPAMSQPLLNNLLLSKLARLPCTCRSLCLKWLPLHLVNFILKSQVNGSCLCEVCFPPHRGNYFQHMYSVS